MTTSEGSAAATDSLTRSLATSTKEDGKVHPSCILAWLDEARARAVEPTRALLPGGGHPWPEEGYGEKTVEGARLRDAYLSGWANCLALLLGYDSGNLALEEVLSRRPGPARPYGAILACGDWTDRVAPGAAPGQFARCLQGHGDQPIRRLNVEEP